jgi:GTP-binding protein LepA
VDILITGEPVGRVLIIHRDGAIHAGVLWSTAAGGDPRQFFDVPIQAAIGSRVIARETVGQERTLAKYYGGDISRSGSCSSSRRREEADEAGRLGQVPQERFAVLGLDQDKRYGGWRCAARAEAVR